MLSLLGLYYKHSRWLTFSLWMGEKKNLSLCIWTAFSVCGVFWLCSGPRMMHFKWDVVWDVLVSTAPKRQSDGYREGYTTRTFRVCLGQCRDRVLRSTQTHIRAALTLPHYLHQPHWAITNMVSPLARRQQTCSAWDWRRPAGRA